MYKEFRYLIDLLLLITWVGSIQSYQDYEREMMKKMEFLAELSTNEKVAGIPTRSKRATGSNYFNVSLECVEPTSVHRLRPRDIDVIGALGDSITEGWGAEAQSLGDILEVIRDRGVSWSIGGDEHLETTLTLPNIIRKFNSRLKGYSTGTQNRWFNGAVAGARARDLPQQTRALVARMRRDRRINYRQSWKIITIMIGVNDLCTDESDPDTTPEMYVKYLKQALDILHRQVPRALVSVVEVFDPTSLPQIGGELCRVAQTVFCSRIARASDEELVNIKMQVKSYQNLTRVLIDSGRYDTRHDFTVVDQPFLRETNLPTTEEGQVDSTYFSPDCFHISAKGHALSAMNLWNNMLQPVGQKSTSFGENHLKCPTLESPYIYTNLNSGGDGIM